MLSSVFLPVCFPSHGPGSSARLGSMGSWADEKNWLRSSITWEDTPRRWKEKALTQRSIVFSEMTLRVRSTGRNIQHIYSAWLHAPYACSVFPRFFSLGYSPL